MLKNDECDCGDILETFVNSNIWEWIENKDIM